MDFYIVIPGNTPSQTCHQILPGDQIVNDCAAPLSVLRAVFTYLDVDPDFPGDVSRCHNVTLQPRWGKK
jgi:hypothetical protein